MSRRLDPEIYGTNLARLLSLGYGEDQARRTAKAQTLLMQSTSQLVAIKDGPRKRGKVEHVTISAGESEERGNVLLHDFALLPDWGKFSIALCSLAPSGKGYIDMSLKHIEIGQDISTLILPSLKTAPIRKLALFNNGPGVVTFATRALETNSTLGRLRLDNNRLGSDDAIALAQFASNHPNLSGIILRKCGPIGQDKAVMSAIVPSLLNSLSFVRLGVMSIDSHGAKLISVCLASNPANLKSLKLDGNMLIDDDAELLADSLKTNDKLRLLDLTRNRITEDVGVQSLGIAVWGFHPRLGNLEMDDLHDANHVCRVFLGNDHWLSKANTQLDPRVNRSMKVYQALFPCNADYTNIRFLDGVPVALMPRVISILRGEGLERVRSVDPAGNNLNRLNGVYLLLREWSKPLLCTSQRAPELRRSDHIHAN